MSDRLLDQRKKHTNERLKEFKNHLDKELDHVFKAGAPPDISIYVTGSYGRSEAGEHSDLDLFLLYYSSKDNAELSRLNEILLQAAVINALRSCKFPDPSDDGVFLRVHNVHKILHALGSPSDDYENHFTARILMLTESQAIHNEKLFHEAQRKIIDAYYNDYHDHVGEFRPVFLMNDVLRFWRTLCLNYEHKRVRQNISENDKAKIHLRNLKLKFARVMTCYSLVIWILGKVKAQKDVPPDTLLSGVRTAPIDRIAHFVSSDSRQKIEDAYENYLRFTGRPAKEVFRDLTDKSKRSKIFEAADDFGKIIAESVQQLAEEANLMRYLLV